jgi:hypothetical protein
MIAYDLMASYTTSYPWMELCWDSHHKRVGDGHTPLIPITRHVMDATTHIACYIVYYIHNMRYKYDMLMFITC